jgi:hypothetical protein
MNLGLALFRFARWIAASVLRSAKYATRTARGLAARVILIVRPDLAASAALVAGSYELPGVSLSPIFEHMLRSPAPRWQPLRGRVVLVCGNLAPGGAERQVAYTLRGFAARRIDVSLLCHSLRRGGHHPHDFYLPLVQAANVIAREIRRRTLGAQDVTVPKGLAEVACVLPPDLVVDIADLYREFVELRPQVVHSWLDWDNVRAGLAAALAGVPRVITAGRNISPRHFALYQSYMGPAYRALARLPNVTIINNSRAGADDYADWIGIPRERIAVVRNAVEVRTRSRLGSEQLLVLPLESPNGRSC